jgi:hypothetical protein
MTWLRSCIPISLVGHPERYPEPGFQRTLFPVPFRNESAIYFVPLTDSAAWDS